ncbi:uncharacterized protein PG998_010050 [Apiospora kogelbergensis]|uniref:uncharacterized protein n=1 Tax=Apiospora kogelbergensis TaxID=1337665 RepID=UPI00312D16F5
MASNVAHGKCLCGAVEIKAEGESMTTVACSCTNCQTCGGTTYTVNLVYPKDTVTVTSGMEDIREYEDKNTDSGRTVLRRFCGRCGSGVFSQAEDGRLFIKAPILKGVSRRSLLPTSTPGTCRAGLRVPRRETN